MLRTFEDFQLPDPKPANLQLVDLEAPDARLTDGEAPDRQRSNRAGSYGKCSQGY